MSTEGQARSTQPHLTVGPKRPGAASSQRGPFAFAAPVRAGRYRNGSRTDEPQRSAWRHRLGQPCGTGFALCPGRSAAPAAQGRTGRRSRAGRGQGFFCAGAQRHRRPHRPAKVLPRPATYPGRLAPVSGPHSGRDRQKNARHELGPLALKVEQTWRNAAVAPEGRTDSLGAFPMLTRLRRPFG